MFRCGQCGEASHDGKTCAERFYAQLANAEGRPQQDLILLAARYALAHPRTHSPHCLALARAIIEFSAAAPPGRRLC